MLFSHLETRGGYRNLPRYRAAGTRAQDRPNEKIIDNSAITRYKSTIVIFILVSRLAQRRVV